MMELLVIRHAIALDRAEFARSGRGDDERPISDEGERKMQRAAGGLRVMVASVSRLGTSPFLRAQQTAQIVAKAFDLEDIETVPALTPSSPPDALLPWLRNGGEAPLAIVGHEPHLSSLVSWFIAGAFEPCLELKKGGACLVRFETQARRGGGVLRWLMTPGSLRDLSP
jgi:phosphohistidine phosphatase